MLLYLHYTACMLHIYLSEHTPSSDVNQLLSPTYCFEQVNPKPGETICSVLQTELGSHLGGTYSEPSGCVTPWKHGSAGVSASWYIVTLHPSLSCTSIPQIQKTPNLIQTWKYPQSRTFPKSRAKGGKSWMAIWRSPCCW